MDYDLKVSAEVMLKITHNLLSKSGDKAKIRKYILSLRLLRSAGDGLQRIWPGCPLLKRRAQPMRQNWPHRTEAAAIASELAAEIYNLKFVEKSIEDSKHNFTRFLVISKEFPEKVRTGQDIGDVFRKE